MEAFLREKKQASKEHIEAERERFDQNFEKQREELSEWLAKEVLETHGNS